MGNYGGFSVATGGSYSYLPVGGAHVLPHLPVELSCLSGVVEVLAKDGIDEAL